ncbi:MAG: hypothetical protein ACK481_08215 [Candidatus Melainabacteria bacterium]|jgi:hypothetical protein
MKQKKDLIEYTKEVWQPYYEEPLSDSDSTEIISNMTAFMSLIAKWDKAQKANSHLSIIPLNNLESDNG